MIVTMQEDPKTGDGILPLPEEIISEFKLKEDDTVHLKKYDDGKIEMSFSRNGKKIIPQT